MKNNSANNLDKLPDLKQAFDLWMKKRKDSSQRPIITKESQVKQQTHRSAIHPILRGLASLLLFFGGVFGAYQFGKKHEDKAIIQVTLQTLAASVELNRLFKTPFNYYHKVHLYNFGEEDANRVEFSIICNSSSDIIYYQNAFIPKADVVITGKNVTVSKVRRYKLIPVVLIGTEQKGNIEIEGIKVEPSGIFKSEQPRDYSKVVIIFLLAPAIALYSLNTFMILKKKAKSSIFVST